MYILSYCSSALGNGRCFEAMHFELYVVGAVFLKNTVSNHWVEEEKQFSIHEDDKQVIRENIVQAVIAAPNVIRC